ncbi:hypothetical protein ACWKWU_07535 [Chitinophaga lutea]
MQSQADRNNPTPQKPGTEGGQTGQGHGQGGGQPKPGLDKGNEPERPDIPEEVPKREIERKPSDPQSVPDKAPDPAPTQEIPESEENNDVQEKSPDLMVEDDRDSENLVDTRDRFPFPNK